MSYLRTRPELLARFRDGEQAAHVEVYRAYIVHIDAWLRRGFPGGSGARVPGLTNPADHADAVQEVFMRAFADEARLAYDGQRDYWSYLATVARNVVVDHYRRRGREVVVPGRDSSDPADVLAWTAAPQAEDDPAHAYLDPRARAIVREYVAGLREPLRAVHHAIYVDRSFQLDAAKQLGLSRRKVQKLIERMKREVRALLDQAGIRDSNVTLSQEGSAHG